MPIFLQKPHQNRPLAHLYEHIFLTILSKTLRQNDFLPLIDYEISGKTFDNKIILKLNFYNKIIKENYKNITKTTDNPQNFTNDIINGCLNQISAEKLLEIDNFYSKSELLSLSNQSWQKISKTQFQNADSRSNSPQPPQNYPPLTDFHDLILSVSWQNSPKISKLTPLIQIYAKILSNLSCEFLENEYYAYVYKKSLKNTTTSFAFQNQLRLTKRQSFSITKAQKIINSLKTTLEFSIPHITKIIKNSTEENALISRNELPKNINTSTLTYQDIKNLATPENAHTALSVLTISLTNKV